MMHKKALFFRDFTIADKIMETMHPKEQKSLGRQIHNFDAEAWNEVCQNIVYEGNFAKFKNPKLREYLLATGNEIIVEASPYDAIWGIGFGAEDALENIDKWGQNLLGKAIMRVRDDIRSEMNDTTKEI